MDIIKPPYTYRNGKHDPNDVFVCQLDTERSIALISQYAGTKEQRLATARLFTAAPDLLEALEIIKTHYMSALNSLGYGNNEVSDFPELKQAIDAISKAKGQ